MDRAPRDPDQPVTRLAVRTLRAESDGRITLSPAAPDDVAVEAPLAVRLEGRSVAVIMRSPGRDRELAAGFLLSEGAIRSPEDLFEVTVCPSSAPEGGVVDVMLRNPDAVDFGRLTRHVLTSSACGLCGRTTMDAALAVHAPLPPPAGPVCEAATLFSLPEKQRRAQEAFARTGGQHAAALFTLDGTLIAIEEDVGRHNAVDKLAGSALLSGRWPLSDAILLLSGRASFELIQKALASRIPIVCSVGAPSSLAVALAERSGITLCGFLKAGRANVYTHPARLGGLMATAGDAAASAPPSD